MNCVEVHWMKKLKLVNFMLSLSVIGLVGTSIAAGDVPSELLFEGFDNHQNYIGDENLGNSGNAIYRHRGDSLPQGWDAMSLWSRPPESHLMITDDMPEAIRGGDGRSLVLRRASRNSTWSGDSQLLKYFEEGLEEVYVSFWIKFQPGWTVESGDQSKLFRIGTVEDTTITGSDLWSKNGMGIRWDWVEWSGSGLRNYISIYSSEGSFLNPEIVTQGGNYDGEGVFNSNFTTLPYDLNGDGAIDNEPEIVDRLTGDIIPSSGFGPARHENIYGEVWNRMEFYLKLNSEPGVQDGIVKQWFNGSLILANETVPWIQSNGDPEKKFNNIRLGGNDFFTAYDDELEHQEWYAIADLEIRTSHPNRPGSPGNVGVELK